VPTNIPNPNKPQPLAPYPAINPIRFSHLACYRQGERTLIMQTGPRTSEGKSVSSMNAMSHGLTSSKVVLPGEDSADFQHLRRSLLREHRPSTPTETLLVEEMAQAHWRLDRVRRRQDQAFESETPDAKLLSVLLRYATTYERTFYKSLETLKKLQRERLAQSPQGFVSQKMPDAPTATLGAASVASFPQPPNASCPAGSSASHL